MGCWLIVIEPCVNMQIKHVTITCYSSIQSQAQQTNLMIRSAHYIYLQFNLLEIYMKKSWTPQISSDNVQYEYNIELRHGH